jgi:PAS domain S-box-containing protein
METDQKQLDESDLLQKLVDGTAAETGADFFRSLVRSLSRALGTCGAWVTEYLPEVKRLRTLAFWLNGDYVDHHEYGISGTPCEAAIRSKSCLQIPDNLITLFPGNPDLSKIGAVSYMGFPLIDPDKGTIGNLAVVDTRKMSGSLRNLAVLRIFAARATAELLRLRAENELRARGEKLEGLFNAAMDAIVEFDGAFNIIMINPAAERIFGCSRKGCLGRSLEPFLAPSDLKRLHRIVGRLKVLPRGKRSVWVRDGLAVCGAHQKTIPTEATLSQIEIDGGPCYVLILRDVGERYEARKAIASLRGETRYLKEEIEALFNRGTIIGQSPEFLKTLQLAGEVSATDSTVLISGETGTGKEVIARAIHAASLRKDRPLIIVNCAAIPLSLMESEFFGHEKGAFTGATRRREGRFALADGGTIFLDEVGELNRELQAKLLRVLQDGEYTPVGGGRTLRTDVRVIAATNRDLSRAVRDGDFRTDLFYRLNVFPITVPPLRKRGDDIRRLAEHFVGHFSSRMGRRILPLSLECIERLKDYDWPGNVRELQNVIERGVITARQGRLNLAYALPRGVAPSNRSAPASPPEPGQNLKTVRQFRGLERRNILLALEISRWRIAGEKGAAKLLGIAPSTLQSKLKALNIRRPQ